MLLDIAFGWYKPDLARQTKPIIAAMNGKIPLVTIGVLLGGDKIMSELRSVTNKLDIQKFMGALNKESDL